MNRRIFLILIFLLNVQCFGGGNRFFAKLSAALVRTQTCLSLVAQPQKLRLKNLWDLPAGREAVSVALEKVLSQPIEGLKRVTVNSRYDFGFLPGSDNVLVYKTGKERPFGFWSYQKTLIRDKPGAKYTLSLLDRSEYNANSPPPMPDHGFERRYFYKVDGSHEWVTFIMKAPKEIMIRVPKLYGVYPPDNPYSKFYLVHLIPEILESERVLVIGSGAGHDPAVIALQTGAHVDAIDIDPFAVVNSQATAAALGVSDLVTVWHSDLYKSVTKRYDHIWGFLPTPLNASFATERSKYDVGGKLHQRVLRGAPDFLSENGRLVLVSGLKLEAMRELIPKDVPLSIKQIDFFFPYDQTFYIYEFRVKR